MSYGFAISTQLGLVSLNDSSLETVREIATFLATTATGNIATPSPANPSNAGALVEVLDNKEAPQIFIRADGRTVWTNYAPTASQSTSFRIRWVIYK
jgi:hypothetical protein